MSDADPGFLARWSRRKLAVEAEPAADPIAPPPAEAPLPAVVAEPAAALSEAERAALPRIEELTLGSDFLAFLRPGVPALLRSAALRRMWSLDTAIRDHVGPADYAWDYNDPMGLPPGFSLELGGDAESLLAQAIGAPRPQVDPAGAIEPPPPADAAPAGAPPQWVAEAATDGPAPGIAPERSPRHPLARRHGGALPA